MSGAAAPEALGAPWADAPDAGEAARLEAVERHGMRDVFAAGPAAVREAAGVAALGLDGAVCLRCAAVPGSRMLNHAFGLGLDRPAGEEDLDRIAAFYGGLEHFVAVSPAARPNDLDARLEARGYVPDYGWVKFRRGVGPPPPSVTDLRVAPADGALAEAFGRVVASAYGLPPVVAEWLAAVPGRPGWSCLLALDGRAPVAAAALFVEDDLGWLSLAGTAPDHRGRGGQTALLAARIRLAAERGCALLSAETGAREPGRPEASYRNLLSAGFEPLYLRPNLRLGGGAGGLS